MDKIIGNLKSTFGFNTVKPIFENDIFYFVTEMMIDGTSGTQATIIEKLDVILQLKNRQYVMDNGNHILDVNKEKIFYYPDYYELYHNVMYVFYLATERHHFDVIEYLFLFPLLNVSYMDNFFYNSIKHNVRCTEAYITHYSFIPNKVIFQDLFAKKKTDLIALCLMNSAHLDSELKFKKNVLLESLRDNLLSDFMIYLNKPFKLVSLPKTPANVVTPGFIGSDDKTDKKNSGTTGPSNDNEIMRLKNEIHNLRMKLEVLENQETASQVSEVLDFVEVPPPYSQESHPIDNSDSKNV